MPLNVPLARLEVGTAIDPTHFALDEGRAAFLVLGVGLLVASLLPGLLRRIVARTADHRDEAAKERRPAAVRPGRLGKSAEASNLASTTGTTGAGSPLRAGAEVRAGTSFDTGQIVRCSRCYGKYDSACDPSCPHCREAEASRVHYAEDFPQVETQEIPARTRFHDAERLNAEGVEMLQNMRPTFRLDDAVKTFGRAIELAPRNAIYHSNRGIAHLTNANRRLQATSDRKDSVFQRDLEQARMDVQHAIELRPTHANLQFLLGQVEELAGDPEASRAGFSRAAELDPDHIGAVESLARLEQSLDPDACDLRRDKAEHLFEVAQELAQEDDVKGALSLMDEAARTDPTWPSPLFARAELLNRAGRVDESVEVAREAIEVSGRDVKHLLETVHAHGLRLRSEAGDDQVQELSLAAPAPRSGGGLSGSLAEMGLPDLLQVLGGSQKTVRLELRQGHRVGHIDLEQGQIVHAELAGEGAEEALYELVTWSEGNFQVNPTAGPEERTLSGSNESMILEGLRRLDERQAAGGSTLPGES